MSEQTLNDHHEKLVMEIISQTDKAKEDAETKGANLLAAVEIVRSEVSKIDATISYWISFWGPSIHIQSDNVELFRNLTRIVGAKETKKHIHGMYADNDKPKGYLSVRTPDGIDIYSASFSLPQTCTFKKVEKTIVEFIPEGNCTSWMDALEPKITRANYNATPETEVLK